MSNIAELPVTKTYQRYMCSNCEYDLFEIADANGKLIAICEACKTPTSSLDCPCVIYSK
jgi:hypothetical protein